MYEDGPIPAEIHREPQFSLFADSNMIRVEVEAHSVEGCREQFERAMAFLSPGDAKPAAEQPKPAKRRGRPRKNPEPETEAKPGTATEAKPGTEAKPDPAANLERAALLERAQKAAQQFVALNPKNKGRARSVLEGDFGVSRISDLPTEKLPEFTRIIEGLAQPVDAQIKADDLI